jgi:hypothetical protein
MLQVLLIGVTKDACIIQEAQYKVSLDFSEVEVHEPLHTGRTSNSATISTISSEVTKLKGVNPPA